MQERRTGCERILRSVIGGQLLHGQFDATGGLAGGRIIKCCHCGNRFTAVPDLLACQRIFAACDRQDAKGFVAVSACGDRDHARDFERFRSVNVDNFTV